MSEQASNAQALDEQGFSGPMVPLSAAQALARLLDRRERQVAAMLAGMSSSEHPDEWRDMDRGAGRLSATLLAETELLIQALEAVHPELAAGDLADEVRRAVAAMSNHIPYGWTERGAQEAERQILRLLARRP